MNTSYEQTEMAYNIAIRGKAQKAISELRDVAGAQIRDLSLVAKSNESFFIETMKVVRAYVDIIQSLRGGF